MAFIGRERELSALGAALMRAAEGEPSRIAVSGPLGIGISRLIDELGERLGGFAGVTLLRSRHHAPTSGVPYGALARALDDVLSTVPDDRLPQLIGSSAHDAISLLPDAAARVTALGLAVEAPPLDALEQRGARVRESLFGVIGRLATSGPLVLVVEDLEHSDPGTRELLSVLVRIRRRLPLALIVGYHTDQLPRHHPALRLVREIEESAAVEKLEMQPFVAEEMAAFVEAIQGERPTLGFVAAVMEGSRGNPLIAEQLVAAEAELAALRLSDPFEEILQARVEQLEPVGMRAVRVLAAARRPLSAAELGAIQLRDGHLPRNVVSQVVESTLVRELESGIAIVHELCAEAIEASMLPTERHEVHAALATLVADRPAEAAWHWTQAGRAADAFASHLRAAREATNTESGSTAFFHYAAALELADGERPDDVEILTAAAEAAAAAGAFRRAATYIDQAIRRVAGGRVERLLDGRSARAVGSGGSGGSGGSTGSTGVTARIQAAELSERLGRYLRSAGDSVGAHQAFERAVELAPDGSAAKATALSSLAQGLMIDGLFEESAAYAESAKQAADAAGDAGLFARAHADGTLGVDLGYLGEIDRGLAVLDDAMTTARSLGRLDEVMRCYANRTTLLDLDTRREEALAQVKEGIAEANRGGLNLTYGAFLRGNAADILFQLGRWQEAEAECRAATEFPPAGLAWFSPTLYLALVLVESKSDEESVRMVGQTLLQLETVPAGQWSALLTRVAVSYALWRGELEDARNAAEQGWERVLETNDPTQTAQAASTVLEVCAASAERGRLKRDWSEVAAASELAARVLSGAEAQVAEWDLPRGIGARREAELHLATARGHAARVRGRTQAETWSQLAEAWAKVPVPYQVAKARWWQAQAALPTRSRRSEARRALQEAWKIARDLPAAPLQRALLDISLRARITLPDANVVAIPIEPEQRELVAVGPGPAPGATGADASKPDFGSRFGSAPASGLSPAESRFGLSPRENGVLMVLTEGRTNREIAERLFISERTVAVHVRRILSKLGVSGRTEAAGLAIRLGLVPSEAPPAQARPSARSGRS